MRLFRGPLPVAVPDGFRVHSGFSGGIHSAGQSQSSSDSLPFPELAKPNLSEEFRLARGFSHSSFVGSRAELHRGTLPYHDSPAKFLEQAHTQSLPISMFAIPVTLPNGVIYDQPIGLFIGNEFVAGSAERIETTDPYTSRRICAVEAASPDDVDRVVEVSEKAFSSWKEVSGAERGRLLNKLADLMERDSDLLAAIEVGPQTIARNVS